MNLLKKHGELLFCAFMFLLYAIIGLVSPESITAVLSRTVVMTLFALSFNLQFGYAGMSSLGHSLFFGIGGYTLVVLMSKFGLPLWLSLIIGILFCCLVSAFVGIVCLKNNMLTFTFLSMGIALAVATAFGKWVWVGGTVGITYNVAPAWMSNYRVLFMVILLVCAAGSFVLYLLTKSPFVTMLKGARENEERLVFLGVNTTKLRVIAFTISGSFAALAGMMYAFRNSGAYTSSLDVSLSFQAVIMCVIGGMSVFAGPVIGALIVTVIYNYLSVVTPYYEGALGIIILLVVFFLRDGLISKNGPVLRLVHAITRRGKGKDAAPPTAAAGKEQQNGK